MEFLKITAACILAAIIYGVLHDQVTARICVEYFTVFHPPVFITRSPTLLGIGWGIIATWWAGAIIGILIGCAARLGPRPQLTVGELIPLISRLILFMAVCALIFGVLGYYKGVMPAQIQDMLPVQLHRRFLADWWAHMASYASGFLGGFTVCVIVIIRRTRIRHQLLRDTTVSTPPA